MRKSTQRWVGVGILIAVLFFFGALLVMWATDDTVEETPGRDTSIERIYRTEGLGAGHGLNGRESAPGITFSVG